MNLTINGFLADVYFFITNPVRKPHTNIKKTTTLSDRSFLRHHSLHVDRLKKAPVTLCVRNRDLDSIFLGRLI